jgi:hypothetical protein
MEEDLTTQPGSNVFQPPDASAYRDSNRDTSGSDGEDVIGLEEPQDGGTSGGQGATRVIRPMERRRPAAMPMRAQEVDVFTGLEVTEFLDEYNRRTDNAYFSTRTKVLVLPDYCDKIRRTFIKKLRSYVNVDWAQLQVDMKEHWRDNDTAQQQGTRAYLEAYVKQTSQSFPGLSEYYTNFLVTSDAGIQSRQVHETERGFIFFKGLPKADKELVLMNMPDGPNGVDVSTYDMESIYQYVRKVYRQREGIRQTSFTQAEEDAKRAQVAVEASRHVTGEDIRRAVKELQEGREAKAKKPALPLGVDQEVQDLIDAMGGVKISAAEVETMTRHPAVGPLLREGKNFVYFISQVTQTELAKPQPRQILQRGSMERNDGTFISDQHRNIDPQRGVGTFQGKGEYSPNCNMCGTPGHLARTCEQYQHLQKMGWISFNYDKDDRRTTWYYGPRHKQLGRVSGVVPNDLRLHWLQEKIRNFFEVTNDMMDQPASAVKPELFDGIDSRPQYRGGNNRPSASHQIAADHPGQGNTVTIKRRGHMDRTPEVELEEFQMNRMLTYDNTAEIMALDYIDARDIVMGRPDLSSSTVQAVTRNQEKSSQRTDKVLDQVRQGQIRKAQKKKNQVTDEELRRSQLSEEPTIRGSIETDEDRMMQDAQPPTDDSFTVPYPSQAHDYPFSVVRPPGITPDLRHISADPDNLQPLRKKKVQVEGMENEELRNLLRSHPNRIPTAMLKQEVRGVTIADLLGQGTIRRHVEELLSGETERSVRNSEVNNLDYVGGDASGGASVRPTNQVEFGSLKAHPTSFDWSTSYRNAASEPAEPHREHSAEIRRYVAHNYDPGYAATPEKHASTQPKEEDWHGPPLEVLTRQNVFDTNRFTPHQGPEVGTGEETRVTHQDDPLSQLPKQVNIAEEANAGTQMRHRITGRMDTWNQALDGVTQHEIQEHRKASGLALVQSELPTCWATIKENSIRCLIDTGAQMNLLRLSSARALKIPFEEADLNTAQNEGVVSANGTVDPFLGTAWHVPVRIGQVCTQTHFRIIGNLTRSAILGAPWCASVRLGLQYNVFGRVTCRILSSTGERNATFIASDPVPHHPRHLAPDEDEESEN